MGVLGGWAVSYERGTPVQEKAGTMTRVYYRDASAAIVVFDSTRAETLESVKIWYQLTN